MSKLASEQSVWLKEYRKRVYAAREKSGSKKFIMPLMLLIMAGGLEAFLVFGKDGLNDPDLQGPVKGIAIVAGVMLLLVILLIALGKKQDVAKGTTDNLNQLLRTPEEVKEFDAQMGAAPAFKVENSKDEYIFATKDYFGSRFTYLGDLTYRFIKISDVTLLHAILYKKGSCDVEFRNGNGDVLLTWVADDKSKVDELKAAMPSINVELTPAKE